MGVLNLNEDSFYKEISEGLVLVDFWATWCGPCRMLTPVMERLADSCQGKAKVAKVDIDESQALATKFDISSVPTVIIFKDGEEVERFTGVKTEEQISAKLNSYI